jgi:hypothetical protein
VDPSEHRLVELLEAIQSMYIEIGGSGHPWLARLLDEDGCRDPKTLNYLAATASGTLQDRIFSAANHDREPLGGFDAFNERYRSLLSEAVVLAHDLRLPAARDYHP